MRTGVKRAAALRKGYEENEKLDDLEHYAAAITTTTNPTSTCRTSLRIQPNPTQPNPTQPGWSTDEPKQNTLRKHSLVAVAVAVVMLALSLKDSSGPCLSTGPAYITLMYKKPITVSLGAAALTYLSPAFASHIFS